MSTAPEGIKKIHVLQVVGDPVGGIRKHVHSIIEGLDNTKFLGSYAYSTISVDSKFRLDLEKLKPRMNRVIPLLVRKRPGLRDLMNIYALVKYVRMAKVDIIHGHGAKGGLYARIVGRVCHIRSVYTPHGGVAHSMFSKFEDALYVMVEKLLYGLTDCFLFESKYTAHAFHEKVGHSSGRWFVNYNGVSVPNGDSVVNHAAKLDDDSLRDDTYHVGVFGLLRSQKGQEYAIRAVSELVAENQPIKLHIYGDGPDRERLEGLSKSLGVSKSVKFHGDVTDVEMHMSLMDIILIPSLFESFGYVAVEAMMLGKPVIVSSTGGLTEVVDKESGVFVQPGDVDDIVKTLMFCLENPGQIRVMALSGQHRAKKEFSLEKMIENISSEYQSLIKSSGVK